MFKISFRSIWRLVKIIALIQVLNVVIGYSMWLSYGYLVSGWTIASLSFGYTVLILAIKKAVENNSKAELK